MNITEMIKQLEELREKHGDLPVGAYHPMANKWVILHTKCVDFVSKDDHDLFSKSLSSYLKYECDFIGVGF